MNLEKEPKTSLDVTSIQAELSSVLQEFLRSKPNETIGSLSKRCSVSEATLRRVYRKKLKSVPTTSTILDLLSVLSGASSIPEIIRNYPGVLAAYLSSALPDAQVLGVTYDVKLNDELENSTTYLIYKLSSNKSGVTLKKVQKLFGDSGLVLLKELEANGFITDFEQGIYRSTSKHFQPNQNSFVRNFKAVASFIEASNPRSINGLNLIKINYSESVTEKTLKEIVKIQRKANEKIRDLLAKSDPEGDIPIFVLGAIDTLDTESIDSLTSKKSPRLNQ